MKNNVYLKRTRTAFFLSGILNSPFWAVYSMLPYILYKDLGASVFHVSLLIILKPAASILSLYWSSLVNQRRDRLLLNVVLARVLGYAPFFFFPFVSNPWFVIASAAFYMMLKRGVIPAWMEILKINVPDQSRKNIFSQSVTLAYFGDAIFPFLIGPLMDQYIEAWRWIFPLTAAFSMIGAFFQYRIPIPKEEGCSHSKAMDSSFSLWKPWENSFKLLKKRRDFRNYQVGFLLGGAGLMVFQPALPLFFVDQLHLSYTNLAIALTVCKSVGFLLTSQRWATWMHRVNLFRFSFLVTFLAALFPIILFFSKWHEGLFYIAYIIYGMMQAGSQMSWNLSGPIFSNDEDSSLYSGVNVLMVGVRGSIVPPLGSLLCASFGALYSLFLGSFLCLLASFHLLYYEKRKEAVIN